MDLRGLRVSDVMQTEVATLGPDERLDLADDVMSLGRVRHLPVLEGTRLVGLVSQFDVMAASLTKVLDFEAEQRRTFMRSVQVREVMTRNVVSVAPDTALTEAARRMLSHRIHCLPVTKSDGTLVGLVTDTDLLRAAFLRAEGSELVQDVEGEIVSDLSHRFQEDLKALRRARDELRVQIHLGAAEVKDTWEHLEKKWNEVEAKARLVAREAEEPMRDVGGAARKLLDEIRQGYAKIRKAL
jgi:CBS domain-containing protein